MPTLIDIVQSAQLVAIERLVRIVRESPSEREARLAAVALLKLAPPASAPGAASLDQQPARSASAPPAHSPPAAPAAADAPLTAGELAQLQRILPSHRPARFLRRPARYWRQILAKHAPLRQAG